MPKLTAKDLSDLSKVMNLAMRNRGVLKGLAHDPAATVDRFRGKIGFGSTHLSEQALDVLGSLTESELEALASIYDKAVCAGAPEGSVAIAF